MADRGGKVDLGSGKAQHVDLFRKIGLRKDLLELAATGAAFVPFLGEGDIALELYSDRLIFGVELDRDVADVASKRFTAAGLRSKVIVGDANRWHRNAWPAKGPPFAVADLDAFSNPYHALDAFWRHAPMTDRVVIFGTDGMRMAIRVSRTRKIGPLPEGAILKTDINDRRSQYNAWWTGHVRPYIVDLVAPATIAKDQIYQRNHMLYWGIVVDRGEGAGVKAKPKRRPPGKRDASRQDPKRAQLIADIAHLFGAVPIRPVPSAAAASDGSPADIDRVERALLEAAASGNVPAAVHWLSAKGGERWRKAAASTASATDMLAELTGRKPPA